MKPIIRFSPSLESEIKFLQDTFAESADPGESLSRCEALRRLMEDMDIPGSGAAQFRRELQNFGINIGIFKPYTAQDLEEIVSLGHRKKYDFKLGSKFYLFENWDRLYAWSKLF